MLFVEHGDHVVMKGREHKRSVGFALALAGLVGSAIISLSAVGPAGAVQSRVAPPVFRPDIVTAIGDRATFFPARVVIDNWVQS